MHGRKWSIFKRRSTPPPRQYELQIGRIEHSYNYRPIFVANFVQSTIILSRSTATSFELSDEFQPSKVPRGGGLMQTSYGWQRWKMWKYGIKNIQCLPRYKPPPANATTACHPSFYCRRFGSLQEYWGLSFGESDFCSSWACITKNTYMYFWTY